MAFQFNIQLQDIDRPAVWRRLQVPETFTFERLHYVIQVAFGWQNSHLYEFSPGGFGTSPTIGITESFGFFDEGAAEKNAAKIKLSKVFTKPGQTFIYIYDFGDSWTHEITLESITKDSSASAQLIAGEGACPPEDCGSTGGYAELKEIMANPKHKEHKEMKEWLGLGKNDKWDPSAFDLKLHRKQVSKL
jgi:hypothetical protein